MRFLWMDNQQYGVKVGLGGYAQHSRVFHKQGIPFSILNDGFTSRGYAEIDTKKRTISLSVSECCPLDMQYVPVTVQNWFKSQYPKYEVEVINGTVIDE